MKKLLLLLMLFNLCFAAKAEEVTLYGVTYRLNKDAADVVRLVDTTLSVVELPAVIHFQGNKYVVRSVLDEAFGGNGALVSVTLPDELLEIGEIAFAHCPSLAKINFPANISVLPYGVLSNCTALKEVCLPQKVQMVEDYAFEKCTALDSIILPQRLQYIGRGAFADCTSLRTIVVQATSPFSFDPVAFRDEHYEKSRVIVPKGCKSAFQANVYWSQFKQIEEEEVTSIQTPYTATRQPLRGVYTLMGKRMNYRVEKKKGRLKGVYIIDGQKTFVR